VALYGVDALIKAKQVDLKSNLVGVMDEEKIRCVCVGWLRGWGGCGIACGQGAMNTWFVCCRLREEVTEQIRALEELKTMAASYGDDISKPAANARQAVQWVYYAYLAAVKEQVRARV
jgi:formate C-acetyltransferase